MPYSVLRYCVNNSTNTCKSKGITFTTLQLNKDINATSLYTILLEDDSSSMAEGKCTFGTRAPIDIHMLNEIIYREVKHFKNYKIYRPNFGSIPVTGKFYAIQDQLESVSPEEQKKIDTYHLKVSQTRALGPKSKYGEPATENMCYGWYNQPLVPMDRNDKRFYNPQQESKHTKIEVIILMSNPKKRA